MSTFLLYVRIPPPRLGIIPNGDRGSPRDLPIEYESMLDRVDNMLYSAEAFVSKRMI